MNDLSLKVIQAPPELVRMGAIYFIGLLLIGSVGWKRLFERKKEGSLRQQAAVPFPLPFANGLGYFLILVSVLFWLKGLPAFLCTVFGYFFLMHQAGRSASVVFGLQWYPLRKIICAGIGICAITLMPTFLFAWINSFFCLLFKIEASAQPLVFEFMKMTEMKSILSFILIAVIAAPLTEEILFRGLLYPILRDQLGVKMAVAISAVLFGAAHFHAPTLLPLTFLGVVLALSYEFSGSLLISMVIHATFNLFTVLNLLLLKPYWQLTR